MHGTTFDASGKGQHKLSKKRGVHARSLSQLNFKTISQRLESVYRSGHVTLNIHESRQVDIL